MCMVSVFAVDDNNSLRRLLSIRMVVTEGDAVTLDGGELCSHHDPHR